MTTRNGFVNGYSGQHGPHLSDDELLALTSPHAWAGTVGMRYLEAEDKVGPSPALCACGWQGIPRRSFHQRLADHATHQRAMKEDEE
jgi:hypothetical protein